MRVALLCLVLFFPALAHASVIISEIAWMGSVQSPNDEWIELYNSGSQFVSLDNWRLMDDSGSIDITLSGSMQAGAYVVLERSDDASAPGSAFMIYTGALRNTGTTLTLYRADGTVEDVVASGKNWESVGGDNDTKETAQYTASGWITAAATPGLPPPDTQPNGSAQEEAGSEDDDGAASDSMPQATKLRATPRTLQVGIEGPTQVYVNQEVTFTAFPSGLSDSILQSLTHRWNFGDLSVATGKEVTHRFRYPGEYVVTLRSEYRQYTADARFRVVVLPVSFSLTQNKQGDLQIHNNARYEIDLSGYRVSAGKQVVIPRGTILLANSTITIPKQQLALTSARSVTLYDEVGTVLASRVLASSTPERVADIAPPVAPTTPAVLQVPASNVPNKRQAGFVFPSDRIAAKTASVTEESALPNMRASATAAVIQSGVLPEKGNWAYIALAGVIGLAVLSVFATGVRQT